MRLNVYLLDDISPTGGQPQPKLAAYFISGQVPGTAAIEGVLCDDCQAKIPKFSKHCPNCNAITAIGTAIIKSHETVLSPALNIAAPRTVAELRNYPTLDLRFAAKVIDTIFSIGILFASGAAVYVVFHYVLGPNVQLNITPSTLWQFYTIYAAVCAFSLGLYQVVGTASGRTLGKLIMGLRIVTLRGNRSPGLFRATVRVVTELIVLGYFVAFLNWRFRTLADFSAGTLVITTRTRNHTSHTAKSLHLGSGSNITEIKSST